MLDSDAARPMTRSIPFRRDARCPWPFPADFAITRAAVEWCASRPSALHMADAVAVLARATAQRPALGWEGGLVVDKQRVGWLPGHRSTPVVILIVAAAGATMPHLGLPVAAGPASTLDVMAAMTRIGLDAKGVRQIMTCEGGCFASAVAAGVAPLEASWWPPCDTGVGPGAAHLVASTLLRRLAAGVRLLLIDVYVGGHRGGVNDADFDRLRELFEAAGEVLSIGARATRSKGSPSVGLGVGPALEAHDVLTLLRGAAAAPVDLQMGPLNEASQLLELRGSSRAGYSERDAWRLLDSGQAWGRFKAICKAQDGGAGGRWPTPPSARFTGTVRDSWAGHVTAVDTLGLGELGRLAGALQASAAGIARHVSHRRLGRGRAAALHHSHGRRAGARRGPGRCRAGAPRARGNPHMKRGAIDRAGRGDAPGI